MATSEVLFKGGNLEHVDIFSTEMYSLKFSSTSNTIGSIKVSKFGQISLLAKDGIHILSQRSVSGDLSAPLDFTLSFLANPKDECAFDVGIDPTKFCVQPTVFSNAYSFALNRTMNPNKSNMFPTLFIECAWSPLNTLSNGSCLLAALSSNNHIYLSKEEHFTGCANILIDVTQLLYENYKDNKFVDPAIQHCIMEEENLESLSKEFYEYSKRQNYLAMTGTDWCPRLNAYSDVKQEEFDGGSEGGCQQFVNCFLCGCNKLGMVFIWQIKMDVLHDNVSSSLVGSFLLLNECATNVSWFHQEQSTRGCIAVSFSNGVIKLLTVDVTRTRDKDVTVTKLQIYDLWIEEDLVHVTAMDWLRRDDDVYLVVVKDNNIILFQINFNKDHLVTGHSYTLLPCTHEQPITGLSCRGDVFVTTSCNGSTESFQIGDRHPVAMQGQCKPRYGCYGMQVSRDGWLLIRLICPTTIVYKLGKGNLDSELVINPFLPFDKAVNLIVDSQTPPGVEMYEYCRHLVSKMGIPKLLKDFAASPVDEIASTLQLQKKLFVKWLVKQTVVNRTTPPQRDLDMKLLYDHGARTTLMQGKKHHGSIESLDVKSKKLLLLAADWLVLQGDKKGDLQLALSVYDLFSDTGSVVKAKSIWEERASVGPHAGAREKAKYSSPLTSRETCPVCKGEIALDSEQSGSCGKGHTWSRCSLTLLIIGEDNRVRACCNCGRKASCKQISENRPISFYHKKVNVNNCPICNSLLLGT